MLRPILLALFTTVVIVPHVQADETDTAEESNSSREGTDGYNHNQSPDSAVAPSTRRVTAPAPTGTQTASSPANAHTAQTGPSQDEYDELLHRVDMMEGDIETLLGEQDKLKEKSLLDRLNWSGSYRFNFNYFHLKEHLETVKVTGLQIDLDENGDPIPTPDGPGPYQVSPVQTTTTANRDAWLAPSWTHRLKLAMTYDFGEDLRFYSQLGVYKYFNETLNTIGTVDHGSNAYPRDNSFRLERVYFDWYIAKWLAISIGRIASPDGPPTELKENSDRRSGWGIQMVNATIDTVMATFYLGEQIYLRTFYSPFGFHDTYRVNDDTSLIDDNGIKTLHSWGALFELGVPKMKDSIFQIGFLHVPQFTPRDVEIVTPYSEDPIPPSKPTGNDLGSYMGVNTLLLLKDIMGSGIDVFGSYGLTILRPTEHRMVFEIPLSGLTVSDPDGEPLPNVPPVDMVQPIQLGLASYEEMGDDDERVTSLGHAVYAGLRYTLPINDRYPTRIGGEFNWGSKYHRAWSHPNDQLVNKLSNKGIVAEGYIIQQLVPNHLFCRVGYLELHRDFSGDQFVGPTTKSDQRIRNIYILVDLAW